VTVFISISFAYNLSPPALNLNLLWEECRRIHENEKAVKQFEYTNRWMTWNFWADKQNSKRKLDGKEFLILGAGLASISVSVHPAVLFMGLSRKPFEMSSQT